jgi:DNA polymerase I-like protein with 3'-5' exonuclease and polymerase domains
MGVSLSPETGQGIRALYIPVHLYDRASKTFTYVLPDDLKATLAGVLSEAPLVGHNHTYDKGWLDQVLGIQTRWVADTRLMFHMSAAPSGARPYSLDDLMTEVLGWGDSHKAAFHKHLRSVGARPAPGEKIGKYTFMADLEWLAKYASSDAHATMQGFLKLKPWFDQHDYWWLLDEMLQYDGLLGLNTRLGVSVDVKGMERSHKRLLERRAAAERRFRKLLGSDIAELEQHWADRKAAKYKRPYNRERFMSHPEEWEKFNLNSDKHKRELFYDYIKLPVVETTESGLPSTSEDALVVAVRQSGLTEFTPVLEAYQTYEKANTLTSNFTGPYLDSVRNGRLHPGFNICGTVSYRLSGFKPYLLNAPFDERLITKNLRVEAGWTGVHADLAAIEPTVTAHYSEDPALLKVFRDGLGDIYLDLALEMFPDDQDLHAGYDPNVLVTAAVKKQFDRQRKVAKVIQLAVQYTGTKFTVAKNLNRAGFPVTIEEADVLVQAYHRKFKAVGAWEQQLRQRYREDGLLRNVTGRIIRVPNAEYKDLPNRFIQSSAHDILRLWVLEIYRLCQEAGIELRPILIDCHDSTSNACETENVTAVEAIYDQALANVNRTLGLCVTIRAERKRFQTMAGLKGEEKIVA